MLRPATSYLRPSLSLLWLLSIAVASPAADWGTLTGRFVYEGGAVEPQPLNVTKDVEFCSKHHPTDQSLLVGSDGELQNVIVYLDVPRRTKIDVHPDYAASASGEVSIDNKGCAFAPHVVLVRTGQTLMIKNSDAVGHNTNVELAGFNQVIPAGGDVSMPTAKAMRLPSPVVCNIHPWMKGFVFVRDDPYMAVSSDDGTFEIKNVPAGKHNFIFWHEKAGYLQGAKFDGGATGSKGRTKGRAAVTIAAGETLDLGDVVIPASMLQAGG